MATEATHTHFTSDNKVTHTHTDTGHDVGAMKKRLQGGRAVLNQPEDINEE